MDSSIKQITRYGAYGVIVKGGELLLTQKKSGPYIGQWGLPGGGIEFGETPEEALKRELLEEVALAADRLELLNIASSFGKYEKAGEWYQFHHIGIIYKVNNITLIHSATPEEEGRWFALDSINQEDVTPFARQILSTDVFIENLYRTTIRI